MSPKLLNVCFFFLFMMVLLVWYLFSVSSTMFIYGLQFVTTLFIYVLQFVTTLFIYVLQFVYGERGRGDS